MIRITDEEYAQDLETTLMKVLRKNRDLRDEIKNLRETMESMTMIQPYPGQILSSGTNGDFPG
jgi:cell division septum initiation protein DivIVA